MENCTRSPCDVRSGDISPCPMFTFACNLVAGKIMLSTNATYILKHFQCLICGNPLKCKNTWPPSVNGTTNLGHYIVCVRPSVRAFVGEHACVHVAVFPYFAHVTNDLEIQMFDTHEIHYI